MHQKIIKIFGLLLISSAFLIPFNYYTIDKITNYQNKKIVKQKISNQQSNYFAILKIPKIKLMKELYNNTNNKLSKNIYVLPVSSFPKKIYLASHSGIGKHTYFKYLYKLEVNDLIYIYYQNYIYKYKIKEIEYLSKTGELALKNNYNLILITCTYKNSKTQTIYYGNIENIAKNV